MEGNIMTHDLLVFGEDWGGLPSSTQHLIGKLATDHKTVWINSIGLRRPRLCLHDIKRMWNKMTVGSNFVGANCHICWDDHRRTNDTHCRHLGDISSSCWPVRAE